ncbi:MAG TPA: nucleotide disphospho-sugar-binding domain-containing protein [Actinophytocola sp.]|uniref:nucleotide disphospho-sugar-binding domain-containing protein n=1 Tax=Actinophytocola sp. TaxID=1872138 RepID=UPI002DB78FB5|nr:nucleotide disphospho-sugar-binding domain-containing protein [Actinophytocola sp.]HEU5472958.1 nucleotide disphospho-sugar-binding domain-containing protein [Actinophytocola sp.]
MTTTAVPTHFAPLVPLAWALRAAGHDVLVVTQPDVIPTVRSAGLVAASVGEAFDIGAHMRTLLTVDKRPLETFARFAPEQMGIFGRVWMRHARVVLPGYLAVTRSFQPELIIADQLEYTALLVGGIEGIPVLHHRWGIDPISDVALRDAGTELADLAAQHGLDGLPLPAEKLDPCPPSLQLPSAEPGTPIRFVPFNGNGVLPSWHRAQPGVPRVVVSLGTSTLALNGVPHVRRVLRACATIPEVEVIATCDERYWDAVGPVPPRVRLVAPTPLHLFLDSCDAVVHHGGAGTVLTATAAGLPQLVLPQLGDQFAGGERLQAVGAGICLDEVASQDDPDTVTDALHTLLSKPEHRKAAEELSHEMAGMPAPSTVAADIARRYGVAHD